MAITKVQKEGVETLINNNADNRVITGSGTANTLEGEANLTYNGTRLNVATGDLAVTGGEGGDAQLRLTADEGDDGADYWRLESKASDNNFNLATYASGAWVDKVSVDTSGNVGIGTTSPDLPLHVEGTSNADEKKLFRLTNGGGSAGTTAVMEFECGVDEIATISANNAGGDIGNLMFATARSQGAYPTEAMRIDSSGNVGIGTTAINYPSGGGLTIYNATAPRLRLCNSSTGTGSGDGAEISIDNTTKDLYIENRESEDIIFYSGSERMRIDSSGRVGIGTNSPDYLFNVVSGNNDMCRFQQTTNNTGDDYTAILIKHAAALSGQNGVGIRFQNNGGTTVGKIDIGQSTTGYETSSDYRLKENVESISDGITRLKTLKPYRFNWISEKGQPKVDGFFAHEVTAVPEAISGTKDKVDSDNNPIYQGIDHSKLVPLLTAALQEAIAKIEVLETKVAALEAA